MKLRTLIGKGVTNGFYGRTYFNRGAGVISWFTSKIPEFGWTIAGLHYFGIEVIPKNVPKYAVVTFFSIMLLGYLWSKTGMLKKEIKAETMVDPIARTNYEASCKILGREP